MTSFSERIGAKPPRTAFQADSLDEETRVALWNSILRMRQVLKEIPLSLDGHTSFEEHVVEVLWMRQLHLPLDELSSTHHGWSRLRSDFLEGEWFAPLDTIDRIIRTMHRADNADLTKLLSYFSEHVNRELERHLVGYRIIGDSLSPISTEQEAQAVEEALTLGSITKGAHAHLESSLTHLSDRENPDYANSAKEAILAVESVVRSLTGSLTLGEGLKSLENRGLKIHPALKHAWQRMYGWSSDENGIRHGNIDPADIDQPLARYILVACSAFVSYLTAEAAKVDLLPADGSRGD
ncbi:AbiJ-NTD4 domain-containing protein [Kytococcus sedentarius]|uniref:AbiJ-NTD4 domain-containing protein n=1 Tax=Kytococcus sedentarius TaxID=1276 RepID=UPI0038796334